MTVTIQVRDQDVPNKIDLPVTEDIPAKTNWPSNNHSETKNRTGDRQLTPTNTRLTDTAAC